MANMKNFLKIVATAVLGMSVAVGASAQSRKLVEGQDYVTLKSADRFEAATKAGQIEVVEVFGYLCGHCAVFEPKMSAFESRLPKDVVVRYLPASFSSNWEPYARAYEAAKILGVANKSHGAMFRAIHDTRSLPTSGASAQEIAGFYKAYGVAPAKFVATFNDGRIDRAMDRNEKWMMRKEVEGTPSIIVDGRYKVLGRSHDELLMNTGLLISEIRAKQPKPVAKPAPRGK